MSDLYTIDKTPSTDLEKFQQLRIDALEREIERLKNKVKQAESIMIDILNDVENIDVKDVIVLSV